MQSKNGTIKNLECKIEELRTECIQTRALGQERCISVRKLAVALSQKSVALEELKIAHNKLKDQIKSRDKKKNQKMADIGNFQDHRALKDTPLRQGQDGNMHIKTEVTTEGHNSQKGLKNKPLKSEEHKSLIKKEVPRKRTLHSDSNIKDGRKQSHHKQPLRNTRNGMATVGGTKLINNINQPSIAVVSVSPRPSSQNIEKQTEKYPPK